MARCPLPYKLFAGLLQTILRALSTFDANSTPKSVLTFNLDDSLYVLLLIGNEKIYVENP